MKTKHYEENLEEMILRDYLALDRTKLANERTLLSYIRVFISFLLTGVGFMELANTPFLIYFGIVLSAVSPLFLIIGIYRFIKLKKAMQKLDKV